jgi:hypothetical protein
MDNPTVSNLFEVNGIDLDRFQAQCKKPRRLEHLRDVLGDEFLSRLHRDALVAAVDGAYWLSNRARDDFERLAEALAEASDLCFCRIGRGTVLHKLVQQKRRGLRE